ncbi:Abnormal spindle-like microcephaly-associated protein-like [Hondaea fermentalgiana]|uniref:Abnormal spindle-like microcephaly-associated protein-like n=1 Tax=Hondaea fermentalgiana TaxID=2315210 RepID=A0A2R5G9P7_9STRA|nr:Abnormal spindle-like microcephaly-associated protein-like [Hondaea fermentalgiana]|eukprot:GBG24384.1 Abnormal spindle-like microcephaly-associated protein-like [Hondaea fermentalgiana]
MTAVMHRKNIYTNAEKKTIRGRHERQRLIDFKRIEAENRKLAARLEQVPPFQTNQQLKKEWVKTKKKMATMCAYPLVIARPYRPATAAFPRDRAGGAHAGAHRILTGDVRIFPSRSKNMPVGSALSPKLDDASSHPDIDADVATLGPLGFVEKKGATVDLSVPEPPTLSGLGPSGHTGARGGKQRRHDVFSELLSVPAVEFSHGDYGSNVTFVLIAVHMAIDEVYRALEISVSRLRAGVASQRREDQHSLVVSYSDIFALVGGDTRDTYEAVSKKLWFRNNKLMLTSQLPSVILDVLPGEDAEPLPAIADFSKAEEDKIAKLQARVRGSQARAQRASEHEAAKVLQRQFRRFSSDRSLEQEKKRNEKAARSSEASSAEDQSAVKLQSAFRGYHAKKQRREEEKSAARLQSAFRGYHAKRQKKKREQEDQSAAKLQGAFRGYHAKKAQRQQEDQSAAKLQSAFRGYHAKKQRKQEEKSAAKLQGAFRGYHAKKKQQLRKQEERSATTLQGAFRGYHAKKKQRQRQQEDEKAAKLQSAFRGYRTRRPLAQRTISLANGESFDVSLRIGGQERLFLEIEPQPETSRCPVQLFSLEPVHAEEDKVLFLEYVCEHVLRARQGNLSSIGRFTASEDPNRVKVHRHPKDDGSLTLRETSRSATMNRAQGTPLFIREFAVQGAPGVKIQVVFNAKDHSTRWYEFQ